MITAPDFEKKQIVFVFFDEGEKMQILNENVVVKDIDGNIKIQCSCYRVFLIYAVGHFTITSVVVQKAKKYGFFIACMSSGFHLYDLIGAKKEGNTMLKKNQYGYSGIEVAKKIVKNKIQNQRYMLMKERNKTDRKKEDIKNIDNYIKQVDEVTKLAELMAYEGLAAKIYFRNVFDNVDWHGRQPRLKLDYVNSSLDIGYTLLFAFVDSLVSCYGFDTYVGVLHKQFYLRKSLVCDLVEPMRVLIDHQLKKSINLGQIKERDFEVLNGRYNLKYKVSKRYARVFMECLMKNKAIIFNYIKMYYVKFMKGIIKDNYIPFLVEECQL